MEIKGKVHCFFEQSGTFKNEFIKLGIPAEDYDIQNNFGQTDHVVDLFAEIETAYSGGGITLWNSITCDDLIIAFFPCIYFSTQSELNMQWNCLNFRKKSIHEKTDLILERVNNREKFYALAVKMLTVAKERGLRLIMENPYSPKSYIRNNFILPPTLVDNDRSLRGDCYRKPTAYWFINCEPTHGLTIQPAKEVKNILSMKPSKKAGLCSEERSMISPNYARNFICDFILGKPQKHSQLNLFEP